MKQLLDGWHGYSERVKQWEANGSVPEPKMKFCLCPIPETDWSFGGWHMCIDGKGNETAYEHCPEYYKNHEKKLADGSILRYNMVPDDKHKLAPFRTAGSNPNSILD